MGADATVLVHRRETAEYRPVAHMHVSGQGRIVGKDSLVADDAVVCDVDVGHDPVVVPHPGFPGVLNRAAIDRAVFPDGIAVADHQFRHLAGVFLVLGIFTDGRELKDVIVLADDTGPLQHDMGFDSRTRPDLNVRADDAVGTDRHVLVQTRPLGNDRAGVDHRTSPGVCTNSELATRFPSTSATASKRQKFRRRDVSVAVTTSRSPGRTGCLNRVFSTPAR